VMKMLKTPEELNAYIKKLKNGGLHTKVQSLIKTCTSNSGKNDSLDFEEQWKAYLMHVETIVSACKNSGAAQWGIPLGIEERMLHKGNLEPDKPNEDELVELDAEMAEINPSWEGPNEEDGEADLGEDKDGPHTPPPEQDEPDNHDQGQDNYNGEHPNNNQNVWDENGGGDDGAYGNGDCDDCVYNNGDHDDCAYDNGDYDNGNY
ncbi:hypothetical protein FRC11_003043, partial [Ceratobasidium sp. 423]